MVTCLLLSLLSSLVPIRASYISRDLMLSERRKDTRLWTDAKRLPPSTDIVHLLDAK